MQSILCSLTRIHFLTIEDQQSNYEISILIEELKHEEVQVRLNAMRRIKDIGISTSLPSASETLIIPPLSPGPWTSKNQR